MSQGREFPDFGPNSDGTHIDSSSGCDDDDDESVEDEMSEEGTESEDNIVCYGSGEEDSDEVTEDLEEEEEEEEGGGAVAGWRGASQTPAVPPGGPRPEDKVTDTKEGEKTADHTRTDTLANKEDRKADTPTHNGVTIDSCSSAATVTESVWRSRIGDLDNERSILVRATEQEEQQRLWFYRQLESITNKLSSLPLSYTYDLQTDMARRQLEQEAKQVQEEMTSKLGGTKQSSLRQEARLRRIRAIEAEMMILQQQMPANQQSQEDKEGHMLEVTKATNIGCQATVPLQTEAATVTPSRSQQGLIAAGMPMNSYVPNSLRDAAWPFHKDASHRQNRVLSGEFDGLTSLASSTTSLKSSSSQSAFPSSSADPQPPPYLSKKVDMVYSLLSMLSTQDKEDMSRTLLAMSSSRDSCITMRQSGCLPLLIQLLHGSDKDSDLLGNTRGSVAARARASAALHNIVHCNPDDKRGRRESRTLRLLEQIRAHCDQQRGETMEEGAEEGSGGKSDIDHHPGPAIAALMKLSFDEDHRHAICTLGGLQAMAELLEVDSTLHGNTKDSYSVTIRRYACMALTNLTFGDGKNKALLCSMGPSLQALVAQLQSQSEDLCQGAASVLRNLSWRADLASKKTLREVGAVTALMQSAMRVKKETTLKSILSALWNLSSHSSENKAQICAVQGALQFLVSLLTYKSAGKTDAIVENGGGILRNVSSLVAVREDYRSILRHRGCLQLLLGQLRSPSLTIVSNACGTLWNLSARCGQDQETLREMGAIGMLRNLVHSKHRMISMGSSAALRNLLASAGPGKGIDCSFGGGDSANSRPTLSARKQKALKEELESQNLSETCENVESPQDSPTTTPTRTEDSRRFVYPFDTLSRSEEDPRRVLHRRQVSCRSSSSDGGDGKTRSPQHMPRARSHDSVVGHRSEVSLDRCRVQNMLAKTSHLLQRRQGRSLERPRDVAPRLRHVHSDLPYCCRDGPERKGGDTTLTPPDHPPPHIMSSTQEVVMLADGVVGGEEEEEAGSSSSTNPENHSDSSDDQIHRQGSVSHAPTRAASPGTSPRHQLTKKNITINPGYQKEDDSDSCGEAESLSYQQSAYTLYSSPAALGVSPNHPQGRAPAVSPYPGLRLGLPNGLVRLPHPQFPNSHPVRTANGCFPGSGGSGTGPPRHRLPPGMIHLRFPPPYAMPPPPPAHQAPPAHPPPAPQSWAPPPAWQDPGAQFSAEGESQSGMITPYCLSYAPQQDARENTIQGRPVMLQSIEESDQEGMSSSMIDHGIEAEGETVTGESGNSDSKGEDAQAEGEREEGSTQSGPPSHTEQLTSHVKSPTCSVSVDSQLAGVTTLVAVTPQQDILSSKSWRSVDEAGAGNPGRPLCSTFSTFKPDTGLTTGLTRSPPASSKPSQAGLKVDWQRGVEDEQVDDKTAELLHSFRDVTPDHQPHTSNTDHAPCASQKNDLLTEEEEAKEAEHADSVTPATSESMPPFVGLGHMKRQSISRENRNSDIIIDSDLVKEESESESSLSEVSDTEEDNMSDECVSEDKSSLSSRTEEDVPRASTRKEELPSSIQTGCAYKSHLPVKVASPVSCPVSSNPRCTRDPIKANKDSSVHNANVSSPPGVFKPMGKTENLPAATHSKIPQKQTIPCQYVFPQRISPGDPKSEAEENRQLSKESAALSEKAVAEFGCSLSQQRTPQPLRKSPCSQLPRKISAGQHHMRYQNSLSNTGNVHNTVDQQATHWSQKETRDLSSSSPEADVSGVFTPDNSSNTFSATSSLGSHPVAGDDGSSGGQLSAGRSLVKASQLTREGASVSVPATTGHRDTGRMADKTGDGQSSGDHSSLTYPSALQHAWLHHSSNKQAEDDLQSVYANFKGPESVTETWPQPASSAAGSVPHEHRARQTEVEDVFSLSAAGSDKKQMKESSELSLHAEWNEATDSEDMPQQRGATSQGMSTTKATTLHLHEESDETYSSRADSEEKTEVSTMMMDNEEGRRPNSRSLMTRSYSDAMEMSSSDEGKLPQFSSWQRKRKSSSDDLTSYGRRDGYVRSYSQDNFLKTHKNICNRIVQSTVDTTPNCSASTSHYIQSCTSSLDPGHTSSPDNRLAEHRPLVSQGPAAVHHNSPDHCNVTDFSNSWEKADSEKSIKDDLYHHNSLKHNTPEDDSDDYADDKEDDEEDSDFDEEETYTLEETDNQDKPKVANKESFDEEEDLAFNHDDECDEDYDDDDDKRHSLHDQEKGSTETHRGVLEHEISAEDELLLLENANLIVSEIVTKRDMSGSSTVEEDLLIENETLSLVSNDYTSDTESEVSACWSAHSDKQNEQECAQEEPVPRGRPRIVKPNEVPQQKNVKEEEGVKGIRGRRKPLYSRPTLATASRIAARSDANKAVTAGGRVVGGASGVRAVRGQAGKSSQSTAGAGRGTALPRSTSRPQIKSSIPGPKGPPQGNQRTSPAQPSKASSLPRSQASSLVKSTSGSAIPKSSARGGSTLPSKLPSSASRGKMSTDRPKPPTKQGTFVKEPATPTNEDKGVTSSGGFRSQSAGANPGMSEKEKRGIPTSQTSTVSKTGSSPDGKKGQLELSASQKSKELSTASKTMTGSKLQRPSNIARAVQNASPSKVGGDGKSAGSSPSSPNSPKGSSVGKTNLPTRTSLNKAGGTSGTRRTGPGMTKTSSGSSISKDNTGIPKAKPSPSRGDIKKSESSASLRRGSSVSSPSSPKLRRSSLSTPSRQVEKSGTDDGRKTPASQRQPPSKIAGLKKEKSAVGRSASLEETTSAVSSFKPRSKSSSLPTSARNMSISSLTFIKKSSSVVSPSSAMSPSGDEDRVGKTKESILTRSSTYDKLPSSRIHPIFHIDSEEESDCSEADTSRDQTKSDEHVVEPEDSSTNDSETASGSLKMQDTMVDEPQIEEESVVVPPDESSSMVTCFKNSSDDSISCEDDNLLEVTGNNIDSSTWRKKHQPPKEGEVCLQLPNADETCRSIGSAFSLDDDHSDADFPTRNVFEYDECEESPAVKSRLTSGIGEEKKSKNKSSVAKSIKSTFAGLFNSKTTRYQVKIEISKHSPTEPLPFTSTVSTGTSTDRQSMPAVYTPKPSSGAIVAPVAPFNYSPPSTSHPSMTTSTPTVTTSQELTKDSSADLNQDDPLQKKTPVITEHLTKTEMLLARRRQVYLNSLKQPEDQGVTQRGCMVTTV